MNRWVRIGTVALGVPQVIIGAWAVLTTRGFYDGFPGFGPALVAAEGPYNAHLVSDAGGGFLATGLVLLLAAAWGDRRGLQLALVTYLAFALPHLAYHAGHPAPTLTSGQQVLNIVSLTAAVVVPLVLLVATGEEKGMRLFRKLWGYARVLSRGRRNRGDLLRLLVRRPQLAAGIAGYELAHIFSNRLDTKVKMLAELKAAALTSCEFCVDIGSALARHEGLTERQILDLPRYRDSDAFTELEKLVLEYAECMSRTPAVVPDALRARLLEHLTKGQLVELAAIVAWENQRGRLNQALGVRPVGFSDGAACAIPELPPTAARMTMASEPSA